VTLAARCFDNLGAPKIVDFGESRASPARSVGVERCEARPEFSGVGNEQGVAYFNDVRIAPPLTGRETDILNSRICWKRRCRRGRKRRDRGRGRWLGRGW
jgi:hypothetical protein